MLVKSMIFDTKIVQFEFIPGIKDELSLESASAIQFICIIIIKLFCYYISVGQDMS